MASRRLHIGFHQALGIAIYPALRPAIQLLAGTGIVISLILILFSLTVNCVIPAGSLKYMRTRVGLMRFNEALERYRADCGEYPDPRVGLKALVTNPGAKGWNGPYVKGSLHDPWNRPYLYKISGNVPVVQSLGADGESGGDLFDADVSSQAPLAPIPESSFHAAEEFFNFWIAPWLLLVGSVYALIRTRARKAAGVSSSMVSTS
jgi:general secretion pathway protein G